MQVASTRRDCLFDNLADKAKIERIRTLLRVMPPTDAIEHDRERAVDAEQLFARTRVRLDGTPEIEPQEPARVFCDSNQADFLSRYR